MRFGHQRALDGLRGIAVAAVLLFHADLPWAAGGFHGIDVFFVLSGFLITTLLFQEAASTRTISLPSFWSRRIRRLLPALLAVLAAVCVYAVTLAKANELGAIRRDGIASLLYVSNWAQVFSDVGYFDTFGPRSPLLHTWSLAVEEQYYLIWPVLVGLVGWWTLRRHRQSHRGAARVAAQLRRRVGWIATGGTLAATLWMAYLAPRAGINRVYFGTDTHGLTLLVGSALAAWWWGRWSGEPLGDEPGPAPARRSRWTEVAGWVGAALLLASFVHHWSDAFLTRGGYLLLSLATAAVIASVTAPGADLLATGLSWGPLRRLGTISYGAYLWHWPLYVVLTPARTGLSLYPLTAVRILATLAVAELSYRWIETPLRYRIRWPIPLAPIGTAVLVGLVVVSTLGAVPTDAQRFAADQAAAATAPTTTEPPPPPQTRLLVLGDSLAASLGDGWASTPELSVTSAAWPSCGVATAGPFRKGMHAPPTSAGTPPPCGSWPQDWPAAVAAAEPDVILIAARSWPPLTTSASVRRGMTIDVSATTTEMLDELERIRTTLGAGGAGLMLAGVPSAVAPDEEVFAKVWLNVAREFAAANPDQVRAENLASCGDACTAAELGTVPAPAGPVLGPQGAASSRALLGAAARAWHLQRWSAKQEATQRVPTLLVGDSVGWSLGSYWYGQGGQATADSRLRIWNRARYACELDSGPRIVRGVRQALSKTCKDWRTEWAGYVDQFHPRLVLVVMGNWEVSDRVIGGRRLRFGTPEHTAYFGALLDEVVGVLARPETTVVFLSAVESMPDTSADRYDVSNPQRVAHLNDMLAAAAARHPASAAYIDLRSRVCPTSPCPRTVDGVTPRPDGTHYGADGGPWVAEWLEPQLDQLARSAPPSTPAGGAAAPDPSPTPTTTTPTR